MTEMTAWELDLELSQARDDVILECLLGAEPTSAQERRLRRVMREVARRDYRHRPHGRRCTCAECIYLLEVWRSLQRRSVITSAEGPN